MRIKIKKILVCDYWTIAVLFIVIKLCLHFFTNTSYELHRDEMLYFNMGDHLSFGYISVPPMMGFLAFVIKNIFGYSVFGIRLIPALLGAASIYIIAKIVRQLGGGTLALMIASSAFLLSPGFLIFNTLFTPNVIEQFLLLVITYFLLKLVSENKPELWIWIGILLGLAFLTKYSVLYYILGFFIATLFSYQRKLYTSRYFYYAIIWGIIFIIPNLLWQYTHNWPVVYHLSELKKTQMVNMQYINYFIDIFSLNSASSVIWLIGLFSLIFIKQERKNQLFGTTSLLIILLFLISKGKGYYILGLIPFLFAVGGYIMEKYLKGRLVYVSYFVLFITISYSLITLPYGIPVLSFDKLSKYTEKTRHLIIYPFARWEDGKIHPISQVYADMTGWHELTSYVAKAYYQLSKEEQKRCTIYAERNYGDAGAIHFYGREYNLPDPITFMDSYILWAPDNIPDGPFIYINSEIDGLKDLFNSIEEVGCVRDIYFREKEQKVYLARDPKTDIREVYKEKANSEKNIFR